jgi:hypothetical protein
MFNVMFDTIGINNENEGLNIPMFVLKGEEHRNISRR